VEYDGVPAVRELALQAPTGSVIGLLGPNGAGKSSTLGALAGLRRPAAGSIVFDGNEVAGRPPEELVRLGISLVPEGRRIFDNLTVEENLRVGATTGDRANYAGDLESVFDRFPILRTFRGRPAGHLSGGEQQQLAIGRALVARPRLLLFDEPSLGLAPKIVADVFETIGGLRADGVTVILAEQFVAKTFEIADEVHVLSRGAVETSGTPDELRESGFLETGYLVPVDVAARETETGAV
jgi:branched-chain amino acid transport system ATP-binding protein